MSEWRIALNYRCTNSKNLQSRSVSPHLEAGAGPSVGRKRGRPWSDDATEWPAKRLTGVHPLGWHVKATTFCDYPLCNLKNTSYIKTPLPARGRGSRGGGRARQVSPVGMRGLSSAESTDARPGRTKLFCMTCMDSKNKRAMNFHAECWNAWHGLQVELVHDPATPRAAETPGDTGDDTDVEE